MGPPAIELAIWLRVMASARMLLNKSWMGWYLGETF